MEHLEMKMKMIIIMMKKRKYWFSSNATLWYDVDALHGDDDEDDALDGGDEKWRNTKLRNEK